MTSLARGASAAARSRCTVARGSRGPSRPPRAKKDTGKCNTTREMRETHQHERRGADQHEARGDGLDDAIRGVSGPPRAARGGIQQTRHLLVDASVAHRSLSRAGCCSRVFRRYRWRRGPRLNHRSRRADFGKLARTLCKAKVRRLLCHSRPRGSRGGARGGGGRRAAFDPHVRDVSLPAHGVHLGRDRRGAPVGSHERVRSPDRRDASDGRDTTPQRVHRGRVAERDRARRGERQAKT